MKNNRYKKHFSIDEFARHFFCKHARLNQIRSDKSDKKSAKKINRNICKEEVREALEEMSNEESSEK